MRSTAYILLSPYSAPRRVTREAFVSHRPKLQRCHPSKWVEATLGAIKVQRSMDLATHVAEIHARRAA
jgi:hypothetical protein